MTSLRAGSLETKPIAERRTARYHDRTMEVSEYLVGSPAFKAGDTGDPRMAGSIPVHLRHSSRASPSRVKVRPQGLASLVRLPRFRACCARGDAWSFVPHPRARQASLSAYTWSRVDWAWPSCSHGVVSKLRAVMAILVILGFVGLSAGSAGAAARLLASSPGDGDSLAGLERITFDFDSLLIPAGAEITVTKLDGTPVAVTPAVVDQASLSATVTEPVPSGNYSIAYSVQSSDGDQNTGAVRVAVNAPDQAFSGGLLAVLAIAIAMLSYLAFVFRADQRRRRPGGART